MNEGEAEESYSEYMVKGVSISFAVTIAIGISGILMRMFLSRSLSPTDYGIFYAVFSLLGFFALIRQMGLGQTIVKFLPEFEEKEDFTSLKSSIIIALIIQLSAASLVAGFFFIFSKEIAIGFIGSKTAIPIIRFLSLWFISMVFLRVGSRVFRGFKDILGSKLVELFRIIITFILLGMFSYFANLGATETALSFFLGCTLALSWIMIRLRKHKTRLSRGEIEFSKPLAKKLFYFGLPLIFVGIAGTLTSQIDTLTITLFRTPKEVGYYQVARPITKIIGQVGTVIGVPLLPMLSELWAKDDTERIQSSFYYLVKLTFLFIVPLVLIFLAFPEIIIRILFTSSYLPAAGAVRILSITMVTTVMFALLGRVLIATGKNILYSKLYGLAAVINLVGDVILVPILGIEGAALAFLISFSVALTLEFYYIRKDLDLAVSTKEIFKIVLGGMISLSIILILKNVLTLPIWPEIFIILIPASLFYLFWSLKTRILTDGDLKMMKETLPFPHFIIKIVRQIKKYI